MKAEELQQVFTDFVEGIALQRLAVCLSFGHQMFRFPDKDEPWCVRCCSAQPLPRKLAEKVPMAAVPYTYVEKLYSKVETSQEQSSPTRSTSEGD